MRALALVVAFMAYSVDNNVGDGVSPCDSKYCVCRYDMNSDHDLFSESVVCSYESKVLDKNYSLQNTVYSLDLSRNNLTTIKQSGLLRSETLKKLIIKNNRLMRIETGAFLLPQLIYLDLSLNKLENLLEDTFLSINKLEYLNLSNNKFTSFEKITFHHLRYLKEIVLDNNIIGPSLQNKNLFDRSGYGLTHNIESLSISGIHLNTVYDNFFVDAYNLKKIIISNNNLSDTFQFPYTLEYLDLSDNPIEEISGEDFADLVALKVLKLNNLRIKEIQDYTFAYMHSLLNLELERNRNLNNFSVLAFGQEVLEDADDFTLEKLSIKGSKIRTLNEKLLEPFGKLRRLDLQGNIWKCDCNILWIKQLQIEPQDYEHLRCFTPQRVYNSRVFDLGPEYFVCDADRSIGLAVVVTCLMLTALAFWIYSVPKYQSKYNILKTVIPTVEYTVLPVHANINMTYV